MLGKFGSTPMSQRNAMRARQATCQCSHLGTHLGGKPTGRSRSGSVLERMGLRPALSPLAHPILMTIQSTSELLCAPVRMGMPSLDQTRTSSDCLWGSMSLDQMLHVMKFMRRQLKGTLMTHGEPRLLEDDDDFYRPFSFYNVLSCPFYSWGRLTA